MFGWDYCRRFKQSGIADLKQRGKLFAGELFRRGDHQPNMAPFGTCCVVNFAQVAAQHLPKTGPAWRPIADHSMAINCCVYTTDSQLISCNSPLHVLVFAWEGNWER